MDKNIKVSSGYKSTIDLPLKVFYSLLIISIIITFFFLRLFGGNNLLMDLINSPLKFIINLSIGYNEEGYPNIDPSLARGIIMTYYIFLFFIPLYLLFKKKLFFFFYSKYRPCPHKDCNNSVKIYENWRCDFCKEEQGKERFITKKCVHCKRFLESAICEHCHREFDL